MAERASIFDSNADFDVSGFAPQKPKPAAPREKVRQVSEGAEFKSREPEERSAAPRKLRRHRTGRNIHLAVRVTRETYDEFYQISDRQGWLLGQTMERALQALERELGAPKGSV